MKLLGRFLLEKIKWILLFLIMAGIFGTVGYMNGDQPDTFWYSFLLSIVIGIIAMAVEFFKLYTKNRDLSRYLTMQNIYTFDSKPSEKIIEADYEQVIHKIIEEKDCYVRSERKLITEMKDYYTMWIHQIKTPIFALNLLFQALEKNATGADESYKADNIKVSDLKNELFKIECYAEAALQYLRLEDMSSDLNFGQYSLDVIVKKAVKKFANLFITNRISIELDELDTMVLTDEKWLVFVIEQILSNAIKYSKPYGKVSVYLKQTFNVNDKILVIQDEGIGISSSDLPRIFEKGFTGFNGRMDKKSTGIGLYLSKKAMTKLSHSISIESLEGKGTKVFLDLTVTDMTHE